MKTTNTNVLKVDELQLNNSYIAKWMDATRGGETPEIYHLWGALSAIASAMGRDCHYKHGDITIYPNMYVIITGGSGNRKSVALSFAQRLLQKYTKVIFGPDDTAGKRQGILRDYISLDKQALIKTAHDLGLIPPSEEDESKESAISRESKVLEDALFSDNAVDVDVDVDVDVEKKPEFDVFGERVEKTSTSFADFAKSVSKTRKPTTVDALVKDKREKILDIEDYPYLSNEDKWTFLKQNDESNRNLCIYADELITLTGQNQFELIAFLTAVYSCQESYAYGLARSKSKITRPCLNLLACTPPSTLSTHLPEGSIGLGSNGFGPRVMFIYSPPTGVLVYKPPAASKSLLYELGSILQDANLLECEFTITEEADKLGERIYMDTSYRIDDTRFIGYYNRRRDMLFKVCQCLAAGEGRTEITEEDVADAHTILLVSEKTMPSALGEAGKEPISKAKSIIIESLTSLHPIPHNAKALQIAVCRDISRSDYLMAIQELVNEGRIMHREIKRDSITVQEILLASKEKKARDIPITTSTVVEELNTLDDLF